MSSDTSEATAGRGGEDQGEDEKSSRKIAKAGASQTLSLCRGASPTIDAFKKYKASGRWEQKVGELL